MIAADDPRHGTPAGHNAGCRCAPCDRAKLRYDKHRRAERHATGERRVVPSHRITRRIEALQTLGWPLRRIARESGLTHNHMNEYGDQGFVLRSTFEKIAEAYERLSMTLPPETTTGERSGVARTRNHARRQGFVPPLGWDDIDTDVAPPRVPRNSAKEIDEAIILRVVNGEPRPRQLTPAEAAEVVRILLRRGVSTTDISRQYQLKAERYVRVGDAA